MAGIGSKWRAVLLDLLERSGWSAGQVFFATLLAGGTTVAVTGLPWKYASTLAISAAVSSLVLTALQYLVRWTDLKFWPDTLARLAKTFLASVAASVAADKVFDITSFDWGTAFDVAFLATISSLGKGLLAREQAQPAPPPPATDGAVTAVAADLRTTPSTLPTQTYVEAVKR
ncbi:hypothetical protein EV643_12474 [Kribbella sp. VKM Ac-2527]|uniref:Phage r1t holin n=1 Tax=Kribbella caucasensis TaxID=2512215 RepID=A0A4V3C6U6_9ACTN|nr:hypothetical protein [Kribbella sp. VKM Ac-2527]TDO35188.1 hypothetical protein EV643_12474 [Kribbella sp. VKM Ac-2527]